MNRYRKHSKSALVAGLMIALAVSFVINVVPTANAQVRTTLAFVSEYPNPVAIGQNAVLIGWVTPPPIVSDTIYYNYTFTITRPDGTHDTLTRDSSVEATASENYVCAQTGTWSVVMSWPGDVNHNSVTSPPFYWNVTTTSNVTIPKNPLPTGPWSWPINAVNYEWYQISGDWSLSYSDLGSSGYQPYSTGPTTAHILWKQSYVIGGLLGGDQGYYDVMRPFHSIAQTPMVEGMGRLYYIQNYAIQAGGTGSITADNTSGPILHCLDQLTGQELWKEVLPCLNYTTNQVVSAAQRGGGTLQFVSLANIKGILAPAGVAVSGAAPGGNQYASVSLWVSGGGLWRIDPITGQVWWYDLSGKYANAKYYDGAWYVNSGGNETAYVATLDKTDPFPGPVIWTKPMGSPTYFSDGYIIQVVKPTGYDGSYYGTLMYLNTWNAQTGALVGNGSARASYAQSSEGSSSCAGEGHVYLHCADMKTRAWSFTTGALDWTSAPMDYPWGVFGGYSASVGEGLNYQTSYDGHKYAYNTTNGNLVWRAYTGTNNPYTSLWPTGSPPAWGLVVIGQGKAYWASGEHTPAQPGQPGCELFCTDVLTGQTIWSLPNFRSNQGGGQPTVAGLANGMLWMLNSYDGCVYMFGQGSTATTVSTSPQIIANGASTMITGTVTDQTPYLKGTPAVSDGSMSDWMAYKVEQVGSMPSNITGVTVHLVAVSSNGAAIDITHVTTDASGFYNYVWTPPTKDTYKIVASFDGSGAYYSSQSETALGVIAAVTPFVTPTPTPISMPTASPIVTPTVAPTPTPTTPQGPSGIPASTMYAIAAAIVVIVIVAVAAVALRRRK